MMNCSLHSPDGIGYLSAEWHDSQCMAGVRFATSKMSLGRRLALTERLRELFLRYEFLKAGDAFESTEAALADLLVRRLYLEWGLVDVEGLAIDGSEATVQLLIEQGPEALSNEIVAIIRAGLELSEEERKNS
jgi:hypothetical protein